MEFSGRGFKSHSGQLSIVTSKNPSVMNTIYMYIYIFIFYYILLYFMYVYINNIYIIEVNYAINRIHEKAFGSDLSI